MAAQLCPEAFPQIHHSLDLAGDLWRLRFSGSRDFIASEIFVTEKAVGSCFGQTASNPTIKQMANARFCWNHHPEDYSPAVSRESN